MRFAGFIGPSYQLRSVNVDCQQCINLYPEVNELGTGKEKEVASLVSTPGLTAFSTLGVSAIRGLFTASNGRLFAAAGNQLYEVSSNGSSTAIGTLSTASGAVSFADNGIELCLVDGAFGYSFNFASTFARITDVNFTGSNTVVFQDGYFVFATPNSRVFYLSGLNALTFDALDTFAIQNTDNIVGLLSDHENLWVFSENSTYVYYNAGASTTDAEGNVIALFPFQRIQGAYIEIGCAAYATIKKMNNTIFWVGKDERGAGMVYSAKGFSPVRISTHALEYAIKSYGDISTATAFCYQENGHSFYAINFPNASTTWVFDSTTSLWHERQYSNDGVQERGLVEHHAYAFAKHIVGDYKTGALYVLDSGSETDAGQTIMRRRRAPHFAQDMKSIFHSCFELDVETGVGLDGIGLGTSPQVILRYSDDHGHSWSFEQWRSLGKIGERHVRPRWRRLGRSRDRVYEITITDPVNVTLIGAELDVSQGAS